MQGGAKNSLNIPGFWQLGKPLYAQCGLMSQGSAYAQLRVWNAGIEEGQSFSFSGSLMSFPRHSRLTTIICHIAFSFHNS
jgi:hypothetical protein